VDPEKFKNGLNLVGHGTELQPAPQGAEFFIVISSSPRVQAPDPPSVIQSILCFIEKVNHIRYITRF
jgi:hypothetical protein